MEESTAVNVLKFRTTFSFYSQIKCWISGLEFTKCLSKQQTMKTLIRLLLQNESDLGLHLRIENSEDPDQTAPSEAV